LNNYFSLDLKLKVQSSSTWEALFKVQIM
jgi:hypothetical protein